MHKISKSLGALFLALILAAALCVGCFYGLKFIGNSATGVNPSLTDTNYENITTQKLSEEKMKDAVQLFNNFFVADAEDINYSYKLSSTVSMPSVTTTGTVSSTVIYARQAGAMISEFRDGVTTYYDLPTQGKYIFNTLENAWGIVPAPVMPSDDLLGNIILTAIPDLELTEDGKAYTLSDFQVQVGTDAIDVETLTVKFSKKKLVYASFKANAATISAPDTATYWFFDFGRTEVSLPQV